MKSEMHAVGFLLLFIFLFVFFSSSCTGITAQDKSEYTKNDFTVEVRGSIEEKEIGAILYSRPHAEGEEARAILRFTYPESLCGMTATLSANGEQSLRLGDTVTDADGIYSLTAPFRPIYEMGEPYSLTKDARGEEKVRICDENCDLVYIFPKNSNNT